MGKNLHYKLLPSGISVEMWESKGNLTHDCLTGKRMLKQNTGEINLLSKLLKLTHHTHTHTHTHTNLMLLHLKQNTAAYIQNKSTAPSTVINHMQYNEMHQL